MTLQEVFDSFILSRQLADLSPKTITAYRDFVSPFIAALSPDKPFLDIQQSRYSAIPVNASEKAPQQVYKGNIHTACKDIYIKPESGFLLSPLPGISFSFSNMCSFYFPFVKPIISLCSALPDFFTLLISRR